MVKVKYYILYWMVFGWLYLCFFEVLKWMKISMFSFDYFRNVGIFLGYENVKVLSWDV